MKYLFLLGGIVGIVAILIVYFQLFAVGHAKVLFFQEYISMTQFATYITSIAFFTWVCLALGIQWLLSWWEKYDDDFNL